MTAQLKWPAYAQRLFRERARGKHPLRIDVYFGQRWPKGPIASLAADPPWLPDMGLIHNIGIPVEEYAPGIFDLRVLAGVACKLHWGDRLPEREGWGVQWWLAAECCRYSDYVVMDPDDGFPWAMAACARIDSHGSWPPWWSDELELDYQRRSAAWSGRLWEALRQHLDAEDRRSRSVRSRGGRGPAPADQLDPG